MGKFFMSLILLIGDFHLQSNRLEDGKEALSRIAQEILDRKPTHTIFTGDQFHTFATIRSEVLAAWNDFINQTFQHTKLIFLVGNHDMSGPNGGSHSMEVFNDRAIIVDDTFELVLNKVFCLPFIRDNAEFEAKCRKLPEGATLICHNSFNGAQFENGFYDPHGADPSCVEHLAQVIAGHVHKEQKVANVWFCGTPYQMSYADAGEEKGIYAGEMGPQGIQIKERIHLGMPIFIEVKAKTIPELLENLPVGNNDCYYKFEATGTPQEIEAFWKDERIKAFKASVREVRDALISTKPAAILAQVNGKTLEEKLKSFIESREWKVDSGRVYEHARRILAQTAS